MSAVNYPATNFMNYPVENCSRRIRRQDLTATNCSRRIVCWRNVRGELFGEELSVANYLGRMVWQYCPRWIICWRIISGCTVHGGCSSDELSTMNYPRTGNLVPVLLVCVEVICSSYPLQIFFTPFYSFCLLFWIPFMFLFQCLNYTSFFLVIFVDFSPVFKHLRLSIGLCPWFLARFKV